MICAVLLLGGAALAGGGGTESPFSLGTGARSLGLGTADLVYCSPAVAAYWNPAGLALTEHYSLEAFHSGLYDSDAGYQYFGFAVPTMDIGSFGVGIFRLGVDGIEKRDASNLYLGLISDSRLGLYLGYGHTISKYDIGAAITVEQHSPDVYSATSSPGLTLAAGRRFRPGSKTVPEIGATIIGRNLIRPKIKLDEESVSYPYSVDAAVSVKFLPVGTEDHRVVLSGRLAKVEHLGAWTAFGIEYSLQDLLDVRAGLRDGEVSFGLGLFYKYVGFDYAMVDRDLGSLHTFSITAGFGLSMSEKRRIRDDDREAEFNQLLGRRFAESNRLMVDDLVRQGESRVASGELAQAVMLYERALFIAAAAGMDTVGISETASNTRVRLEQEEAARAYSQNMDEARARFDSGDYLGARYFADLALSYRPGSGQARDLLDRAAAAVEATVSREQEIGRGIMMADSLTSYGQIDEALVVMRSLTRVAGDDPRVQLALKRAEFAYWQNVADGTFRRADYRAARAALDSAAVRFPDHPWCKNLSGRITAETGRSQPPPDPGIPEGKPAAAAHKTLSPELEKEVAATYKRGKDLFEKGQLSAAVVEWERVEVLAPGYMSVREYLVDAYKFLGVELYTQSKLGQAVDVWKKAARIAPDSTEIASYIRRTEHEISKLQEISYERR
jgi:tetratricopeptide (TPR) repeat protein